MIHLINGAINVYEEACHVGGLFIESNTKEISYAE
jgi:hypothetical protein